MMMKIFGAVLIVSGGYLLGKVHTVQSRKRLKLLQEIHDLFELYHREMKQYRRSMNECFANKGEIAERVLREEPIKGLWNEEQLKIFSVVRKIKNSSFQDSIEVCNTFLSELKNTIKKMQEDIASQGKALPLVTGAIGLLIAVLLF